MARPIKKRFICCVPQNNIFTPKIKSKYEDVILTVDEYETIRLIDLEKYTQEECAKQMHISRATAQSVYEVARNKIADALVHGKRLKIDGGYFIMCKHYREKCGTGSTTQCHKHECDDVV